MSVKVKAYLDGVGACWRGSVRQTLMVITSAVVCSMAVNVQAQIPLGNIAKISTGLDTSCAITNGGTAAQCWGNNHYVVDGSYANTGMTVALDVAFAGTTVADVVVGSNHACARTSAGAVKCWGQNDYGQLGDNTTAAHAHSAGNVSGLSSGVTAIAAGLDHLCALTDAGAVKCWGRNQYGQLGINSTTNSLVPATVVGLEQGVVGIAVRGNHSCALMGSGGGVKCWGSNSFNELGDGTLTQSTVPVDIQYIGGASKIAAGDNHNCALILDGSVKCWGANDSGQSGMPVGLPYLMQPMSIQDLRNVIDISASGKRTCAVLGSGGPIVNGGAVKCWGSNLDSNGAQGTYTEPYSFAPVDVPGWEREIAAIAVGSYHTCALNVSGNVSCYGWNPLGQLGNNTTTASVSPVAVLQAFKPVPGAITTASGQAVVRFTMPANDSGFSVAGYTVTTSPAGGVDNQAGTMNSYYGPNEFGHLITGLVNGTNYGFYVTATNVQGTGLPTLVGFARPTAVNCNVGTVVAGVTYTGTFTTSDCTDSSMISGAYTRRFLYNAVAGDQLALQNNTAGGIYATSMGGVAGPTAQRLPSSGYVTFAYSGTYVIEVSAYSVGQTSNYSFSVLAPGVGASSSSSTSSASSRPSSSSARSSVIASTSTSRSSSSAIVSSAATSSSSTATSSSAATSSTSAASSSSTPVANCSAQAITAGSTVNGALVVGDCQSGVRGTSYYTDIYSFSGTAGQQVFVQLNSGVFDTYAYLKNSGGTVIASNDDSGGGTNSRIPVTSGYFTLPATGVYTIEVSSYASLNTGAYTLSLFAASASSSSSVSSSSSSSNGCVVTTGITLGVASNGNLTATDCTNGARGTTYYTDRFGISVNAGQQISILLTSSAFDSYVYLKSPAGTVLVSNDDGGGGTNSRIPATSGTYTVPATGTYIIEVTSYSAQITGAYTLLVN
jgi:alpha-tubulin suppressor-like RCC1 family protein